MERIVQPGGFARRALLRRALGVVVLVGGASRLAAAAEAEVKIDNFVFAPTPLMVKTGMTVKWLNDDDIPHSIVCPALKVKSHPMDTGESFAYTFDRAGTFDYLCGLHPHMQGKVLVRD